LKLLSRFISAISCDSRLIISQWNRESVRDTDKERGREMEGALGKHSIDYDLWLIII